MTEDPVLVTGATGFLGSHLCRALTSGDREVRALCRSSSDRSALADADIEWVVGDVTNPERMQEVIADCTAVYHLAGIGLAAADPDTVRQVNVTGTENVLAACKDTGVDRVVFTSTAGTRRSDGIADETDVAEPVGAYQESKARAESVVDEYVAEGLDVVTVLPTSVFGPRDTEFTGRLLGLASNPAMIAYLPGGVSFAGVEDVVDGIQAAMDQGTTGERYILGGENLAFSDALSVISEEMGGYRPVVPVPGTAVRTAGHVAETADSLLDIRFFPFTADMASLATSELFYSSAKAKRELDYTYRPLRELVEPAAQWFRNSHA